MYIRILNEADAKKYQEVRLSALKNNPESFGSTYERELEFSYELVAERIKPAKDKFVLGAFNDVNSLLGIVTFVREKERKFCHKGDVFGMYVKAEYRRLGLGRSLMNRLIKEAKKCGGLEQIRLTVVSNNDSAKKLYQSIGFEVYGVEKNAIKYHNQYFDEDLMVLYTNESRTLQS